MTEPSNHSAHVTPHFSKRRADAQWSRIAERLPGRKKSRGPALQLAGAMALVCALSLVWWWNEENVGGPSVWAGSLVSSDEAPVNFTLAEGTLIELEPRSEVELLESNAGAVKVSLKSGSARFDVARRRTRRFSVRMGEVEVQVTGTAFRLRRAPSAHGERVRVDVEEGSVEVHRAGEAVRLAAGEHWSTFVATAESQARAPEPPAGDGSHEQVEAAGDDEPAAPSRPPNASPEPRRRAGGDDALELFERANAERRLGRLREAAASYAELVARHPRDRRAAIAAFELGRIRMDSLGDMRGAAEALERALKLDARRAFAEDALARLVLAKEALGLRKECESARERYLSRYPDGVHAGHLAERCSTH